MKTTRLVCLITLMLWCRRSANGENHCENECRHGPGNMKCQSCFSGCYGQHCQHRCIGNCDTDGCHRETGLCHKCGPGFYDHNCDQQCPSDCMSGRFGIADCDRETGSCFEHCTHDKTGIHCQHNCPSNCASSTCTKIRGICFIGCKQGWQGSYCNVSCSNCIEGRCASNGYCTIGCKPGFFGDRCETRCPHCYLTGCTRDHGICEQCHPGYHGSDCNSKCNNTCYRGRDGHRHCNRTDGRCEESCL